MYRHHAEPTLILASVVKMASFCRRKAHPPKSPISSWGNSANSNDRSTYGIGERTNYNFISTIQRYSSVYIFASQVTAVLLPESRHISNRAHNEAADRRDIPEFELDISWTGNETHGVQPPVPKELLEEGGERLRSLWSSVQVVHPGLHRRTD
jgi:hypothetical protein